MVRVAEEIADWYYSGEVMSEAAGGIGIGVSLFPFRVACGKLRGNERFRNFGQEKEYTVDRVKQIFANTFHVDPQAITEETTPQDIEGWDSLGQLSLVLALEQQFGITFETKEIFEIMKVGDIYRILQRRGIL